MVYKKNMSLAQLFIEYPTYAESFAGLVRDVSLSSYLNLQTNLSVVYVKCKPLCVEYLFADSYSKKAIVIPFDHDSMIALNHYIRTTIQKDTLIMLVGNSIGDEAYQDSYEYSGGYYYLDAKAIKLSCDLERRTRLVKLKSDDFIEQIKNTSLPICDHNVFASWLDSSSESYCLTNQDDGKYEAILSFIRGEFNVISYYWDKTNTLRHFCVLIGEVIQSKIISGTIFFATTEQKGKDLADIGFDKLRFWSII